MCGVAGWFGPLGVAPRTDLVNAILEEQVRRGPDHQATKTVDSPVSQVTLGHNRLAIIDLSQAANQPMTRGGSDLWVTYNGEIYNYVELRSKLASDKMRFSTSSDTEVLLAAWQRYGPDAPIHFNGMFAFGLFDGGSGDLWLVRDRFGVKPLYYGVENASLVFASSPGAVARRLGRLPNLDYASRGNSIGIYEDGSDVSAYEGVRAVLAGTRVRVRLVDGALEITNERYYHLTERVAELREGLASESIANLTERTRSLCQSATRLRLRSDVPVGLSLSGGIDSSSVAALAVTESKLVGFSFGAPDEPRSEGPFVAQLAESLGIRVSYIPSNSKRVLADLFDAALAAQDAPFPGCSILAQYAVCQRARSEGVKVLLGGQGGDEAFMGYHKFKIFRASELARRGNFIAAAALGLASYRSLTASGFGIGAIRHQVSRYRARRPMDMLLSGLSSGGSLPKLSRGRHEPLWERQLRDVTALSLPTLLRYEDRNSMGCSIESRLPFVDYRVVEFGLALPEEVKLRKGYGKWIVREGMKARIPDGIRTARWKRGFDANHGYAIASGLGDILRNRLHDAAGEITRLINAPLNINNRYDDQRLIEDRSAFGEAVALIWLGQRFGGIGPGAFPV